MFLRYIKRFFSLLPHAKNDNSVLQIPFSIIEIERAIVESNELRLVLESYYQARKKLAPHPNTNDFKIASFVMNSNAKTGIFNSIKNQLLPPARVGGETPPLATNEPAHTIALAKLQILMANGFILPPNPTESELELIDYFSEGDVESIPLLMMSFYTDFLLPLNLK